MPENLLETLRVLTLPHHRRLEAALDLMEDDLTLVRYAGVLRVFHRLIGRWEAESQLHVPPLLAPAFDARRKAAALDDDLRVVAREMSGYAGAERSASDGSRHAAGMHGVGLPVFENTASWLGGWYVIEGSTLGGRVIAPHICERLGLTPDWGVRYFSGYGLRTGSMWNSFRAMLVEAVEPATQASVIEGARRMFDAFYESMVSAGVARRVDVPAGEPRC